MEKTPVFFKIWDICVKNLIKITKKFQSRLDFKQTISKVFPFFPDYKSTFIRYLLPEIFNDLE